MLGLGYSVGTGPEGIKAEVIVVKSFDELDKRASEVRSNILLPILSLMIFVLWSIEIVSLFLR